MVGEREASIRVLHVDDDDQFRTLTERFLADRVASFDVVSAEEGSEALAVLGEATRRRPDRRVDCIVSDYEMPGMDGLELLERVRGAGHDQPFILFTGKGSEEVASSAITAGATDYLRKQHHADQFEVLANRVENAVDNYRIEDALAASEARFRALTESATDAILTIDEGSVIRFANPAVERVFGYPPAEVRGERLTSLMPERLRSRHCAGIERYLDAGERTLDWTRVPLVGLRSDGEEVPLSVSFGEYARRGERRFVGVIRPRSADA